MRRVADAARAARPPLAAAAAEAAAAFGDGAVYLEREIRPARHVEVQLLGDHTGTVVALGERDCSIQRRHQKLVEEAPAPGLIADERARAPRAGGPVAAAAGLTQRRHRRVPARRLTAQFWFLEVNTRLQVEHGVTELVTDVDIVREQLVDRGRAAAVRPGRSCRSVRDRARRRHAIEVRLSAEDPARAFAPAPGTVTAVDDAGGARGFGSTRLPVRGDRVPPDYDPLVAKILVVDADRERALARLGRALDETVVTGIQTSLPFHRWIARNAAFRRGPLPIDWVDSHWADELVAARTAALEVAMRAAAAATSPSGPGTGRAADHAGPAPGARWVAAGRARALGRRPR